ncbi:hypothetical protein U1769_13300 [Sphingomonas sp. ZT3P38]|uniref:hypothetical protein n=1 Tax=Parasphingomonas zepuensis TaxID=3096161 RepID=UPI002FC8A969
MANVAIQTRNASPYETLFLSPDGIALRRWAGAEPSYDFIYLVTIVDINPTAYVANVRRVPARAGIKIRDLGSMDLLDLISNGKSCPWAMRGGLNLLLRTKSGALVIFYVKQRDVFFEDENDIPNPNAVILRSSNEPPGERSRLHHASWLDGIPRKAVTAILEGYDPNNEKFAYGLQVLIDAPPKDPSRLDIDPKIENDGGD